MYHARWTRPGTPLAALLAASASLLGCGVDDVCPGDDLEYDARYAVCVPAAMDTDIDAGQQLGEGDASMAAGDAGAEVDSAAAEQVEEVEFGAECSDDSDCGPGTCVNSPLPLGCTQSDCNPGEANEGVCPADWMCLTSPSTGESGCVKF